MEILDVVDRKIQKPATGETVKRAEAHREGVRHRTAPCLDCPASGTVGFSFLQKPEKINRLPKEVCVGKVRKYSIRMIRLVKPVFIIGVNGPCVGDVIGIELKDAYSLLVIAAILVMTVFYEYRMNSTASK